MRRKRLRPFFFFGFLLATSVGFAQSKPEGLMDYHDYREMRDVLAKLSASRNAHCETVGLSVNYTNGRNEPCAILALRVSANGPTAPRVPDNGDARPSILFDAGIHPREWLTSESLIDLAKYWGIGNALFDRHSLHASYRHNGEIDNCYACKSRILYLFPTSKPC